MISRATVIVGRLTHQRNGYPAPAGNPNGEMIEGFGIAIVLLDI